MPDSKTNLSFDVRKFDLRMIEYFLAVMDHLNISSAAEALRISQPTLSRQIHALEQQFNASLFVRHGRGVIPTEAAKRLQLGLRGLEHQLRAIRNDVAAAADEPSGEVALGIPPSPRVLVASPIIGAYCAAYPKVAIRIAEETSGDLRDLAARGEIDLAITNSNEPLQGLAVDPLIREPMLLVGPHGSELSLKVNTPIERLVDLPLILTTRPNSLRRMVELKMNDHDMKPQLRLEANTLPLMTDLVARGLGYTVLPASGVLSLVKAGSLCASPISGLEITWTIARPLNRSFSLAAQRMLDTIFQVVYDLVESGAWPFAKIERECKRAARNRSNHTLTKHRRLLSA